jgi:hypothetical protein
MFLIFIDMFRPASGGSVDGLGNGKIKKAVVETALRLLV